MLHSPRVVVSNDDMSFNISCFNHRGLERARVVCKSDERKDVTKMFTQELPYSKYTCQSPISTHSQPEELQLCILSVSLGSRVFVSSFCLFFFKQIWVNFH